MEPKAIQNLNKLSGAKGYRYWNQRLKNALDQARPEHGRIIIGILDGITEAMVNNQGELSESEVTTNWVMELIEEKQQDEDKDKISNQKKH